MMLADLRIALSLSILLAVGGLTMVLAPTHAVAQEGDMEKAKRNFKQGKKLYQKGDFEKAAESFLTAYELSDRGELLYNIGQSYRKAGNLQKAEKYFQKYLDENPDANNEEKVVDVLIEIQQKLAERMATIDIDTDKSGLEVYVDDDKEPRCKTPCSISVAPGERTIRIEGGEMEPYTETLTVAKAESRSLEPALGTEAPGRLALRTGGDGGGRVEIAGQGSHSLPLSEPLELEPGDHELTVTDTSGGTWKGTVTVASEETTRLLVPTGKSSGGAAGGGPNVKRAVAYGLAGTSVALITGGVLFGQTAGQTHQTLSDQQSRLGAVPPDLVQQGRRQQTTANILIGAGATTLMTGAGLLAWDLLDLGR